MKLEYYKEVLDFSNIEYHIIFFHVGMAWIVKLSGLILANKSLNGLRAHVKKMHDIQEVSCVREEMQELTLNVLHELSKKMARNNIWHANQIYASFLWP